MKYNVTLNGKIYEVDVTETDAVVTGITQVPVAVAPYEATSRQHCCAAYREYRDDRCRDRNNHSLSAMRG